MTEAAIGEERFQWIQADTAQIALHTLANEKVNNPNGRNTAHKPRLKIQAAASNTNIVVYTVPVAFWRESNMTNLLGC